jgi:hypothetical protein
MASIILRKGALVCQVIYRYIGHAVMQPQQQQCVWLLAQSVSSQPWESRCPLFFYFILLFFPVISRNPVWSICRSCLEILFFY